MSKYPYNIIIKVKSNQLKIVKHSAKMKKWFLSILIFSLMLNSFSHFVLAEQAPNEFQYPAFQQQELKIYFFYIKGCPFCIAQKKFHEQIREKYPEIKFQYHNIINPESRKLLIDLADRHNAQRYVGIAPLTFIGQDFFVGFDDPEGIGRRIEISIRAQLEIKEPLNDYNLYDQHIIILPLIGEFDVAKHSLTVLAIILGALDGFNVCSLGAIILILSLIIVLRSRKKILLYGGTFILTTSLIYGLLMILWYKFFTLLAPYFVLMKLLIAFLALTGGILFIRQFLKFRKEGPVCRTDQKSKKISKTFFSRIQTSLQGKNVFKIIASIFLFAAIITIIEFPCSAAIPVVFTSILAAARLPTFYSFAYIALFVLFYMIDEIIIFLVALFSLRLWLASPKFITWITFVQAIVLFALGFYYLSLVF